MALEAVDGRGSEGSPHHLPGGGAANLSLAVLAGARIADAHRRLAEAELEARIAQEELRAVRLLRAQGSSTELDRARVGALEEGEGSRTDDRIGAARRRAAADHAAAVRTWCAPGAPPVRGRRPEATGLEAELFSSALPLAGSEDAEEAAFAALLQPFDERPTSPGSAPRDALVVPFVVPFVALLLVVATLLGFG